jgi:hypothetical protein
VHLAEYPESKLLLRFILVRRKDVNSGRKDVNSGRKDVYSRHKDVYSGRKDVYTGLKYAFNTCNDRSEC